MIKPRFPRNTIRPVPDDDDDDDDGHDDDDDDVPKERIQSQPSIKQSINCACERDVPDNQHAHITLTSFYIIKKLKKKKKKPEEINLQGDRNCIINQHPFFSLWLSLLALATLASFLIIIFYFSFFYFNFHR